MNAVTREVKCSWYATYQPVLVLIKRVLIPVLIKRVKAMCNRGETM